MQSDEYKHEVMTEVAEALIARTVGGDGKLEFNIFEFEDDKPGEVEDGE